MNIHVLTYLTENNQSFHFIADVFVRFTTLSKQNVPHQEEKIQCFVAPVGVKRSLEARTSWIAGMVENHPKS